MLTLEQQRLVVLLVITQCDHAPRPHPGIYQPWERSRSPTCPDYAYDSVLTIDLLEPSRMSMTCGTLSRSRALHTSRQTDGGTDGGSVLLLSGPQCEGHWRSDVTATQWLAGRKERGIFSFFSSVEVLEKQKVTWWVRRYSSVDSQLQRSRVAVK